MNDFTNILALGSGLKDKTRKTIYISKSVYDKFEKLVTKNGGRSVSLALENLMNEMIKKK